MNEHRAPPDSTASLHIACDLLLDLLRGSQGRLSAMDALIRAAVVQANIGAATDEPEAQLKYAGLEETPPDHLRRPVSVSRLAQSLRLPFETVRRRVKALCDEGFCEMRPAGVVVPTAYLELAESKAAVVAVDALCAHAYERLARAGFFEARPLPDPIVPPATSPPRAVTRLATDYALRLSHTLREAWGDYADALPMIQMMRSTTAHIGQDDLRLAALLETPSGPQQRPVTASRLSADLDLKFETLRRRLIRLADAGLCVHARGGYLVSCAALGAFSGGLAQANDLDLWRLYRGCALLGAVAAWRPRPAAERAAAPSHSCAPGPRSPNSRLSGQVMVSGSQQAG